ncbi:MAG: 7,8-didemethyl-8-hydroxy-5-deazariboflavin synthase CofG, partial [Pseudomonadota bacterium]
MSYSPKVFIPLTHLCRDVCHYCTFAHTPKRGQPGFLSLDDALAVAKNGADAGCHEALLTLGDKPELRYPTAAAELVAMGHTTTISYLARAAGEIHQNTGLLPHLNPGVLTREDLIRLRQVSVSMGIMLESISERLCEKGGPHYGSPDKAPSVRLRTIEDAGKLAIPFTTGLLIGIGETRMERIDALLALRRLHETYGHIQEVIVQNFRPKPNTLMAAAPAPTVPDFLWTIAVARLILGPEMNIQAPPNLSAEHLRPLLDAGINDWGGISPITPDHVNPEAPWPSLERLRRVTGEAGKTLVPRLALYPKFAMEPERWLDAGLSTSVMRGIDSQGYARDSGWLAGLSTRPPPRDDHGTWSNTTRASLVERSLAATLSAARNGKRLSVDDIVRLFQVRGAQF